jgi:tetrapyrrole methylase family protein/MazG family protein
MFTLNELAPILAALDDQPYGTLQIVAATEAAGQYYPHFDPGQPALLIGPGDGAALGCIAEALGRAYPSGHPLTVIAGAARETLPLAALAGLGRLDPGTAIWISPLPAAASYVDLQDVIAHLRAPEGCPWDRELTWARLRASLLEESYELLAALDADDAGKVAEELGDLLLQIGMQTQIAAEEGRFRLPDVIAGIVGKLIRRHPHVFGDAVMSGTDEVLANWEAIKRTERQGNGGKRSPLSGVPAGLPALAQADAYLDRMSRLRAAAAPVAPWAILTEADAAGRQVTPELVGAALFELVAWTRARGVDAESALRAANARFADQVAAEEEG